MTPHTAVVGEPVSQKESKNSEYKIKILWWNVIYFVGLHVSLLYAIYLSFMSAYRKTLLFAYVYGSCGNLGVTAGAHRFWSHRSYKAKWPLKALLCCFFSIAAQNDLYHWCRDHRAHHKFSDTNADPHNIKRGFFFAHIGWLMSRKHPDVIKKGSTLFVDDLRADPIVRFHKRFYHLMSKFFCFILPTVIPVFFWNETWWNSFFIAGVGKYCLFLNFTFLVNSAAHSYGYQPYDKNIMARENLFCTLSTHGEGWHNYHHAFPWDYASSELGYTLNLTKVFIDFMAWIGQAYDRKSAHPEMVKNRKLRSGDGSRLNKASEKVQQCF